MSNIRSLSDLKKDGGRGNAPPGGNPGMPPSGGGGLGGMFSGLGGLMGMGGPQGGGSHDEGKNIKFLHKDGQLAEELKKAGGKLVVIDFTASWCGPCKMIAPHFKQMSEKYTNVVFLKIDVDECPDTAQACGIRAMPTFQFYKNSKKIDEFSGASPDKLQSLIEKHQGSSSGSSSSGDGSSFSGSGYVLGGSKSSSSTSQPTDSSQISNATPQTSSAPAPKEGADPVLLAQLIEMGFSKEHCEKALVATGNKDIEQALNWIEAHPETASTPAPSQPTTSTTSTTSANEATTSTSTSSAPKKIDPMDIDLDDDEEHFIIEEEKKREQRVLTPEEIEIEKRKLQERLAAIRARKAEEEKQAEIEREKSRIKEGKAAIEAKKEWEQKQLEREAARKEREKEEDRKAKAKLQALLDQDKRERAARLGKTSEPAKQTQAPAPKPAEPTPKKEYTEALVQIRLLDGSTIKATFKPTDPLRTVHNHVALLLNNDRFTLNTNFPRKQYSPRDSSLDTTTLQQAECVPNGTFVVQKLI